MKIDNSGILLINKVKLFKFKDNEKTIQQAISDYPFFKSVRWDSLEIKRKKYAYLIATFVDEKEKTIHEQIMELAKYRFKSTFQGIIWNEIEKEQNDISVKQKKIAHKTYQARYYKEGQHLEFRDIRLTSLLSMPFEDDFMSYVCNHLSLSETHLMIPFYEKNSKIIVESGAFNYKNTGQYITKFVVENIFTLDDIYQNTTPEWILDGDTESMAINMEIIDNCLSEYEKFIYQTEAAHKKIEKEQDRNITQEKAIQSQVVEQKIENKIIENKSYESEKSEDTKTEKPGTFLGKCISFVIICAVIYGLWKVATWFQHSH